MKIVMYSNFINHHQLPLAEAFSSISGVEYIFVATTPFDIHRAAMGYKDENAQYDFILRPYEDEKQNLLSHQLAKEADIVIVGSAPDSISGRLRRPSIITKGSSTGDSDTTVIPMRMSRFLYSFSSILSSCLSMKGSGSRKVPRRAATARSFGEKTPLRLSISK